MLDLDRQTGTFVNLNLRPEKHGDENVPGADLKIQLTASNDLLAEFHPSLKAMLYREPEASEVDLVDKAGDTPQLTRLRFGNKVHAIKWDHDIVGATVTVHYGTGGKSDIALEDCTIDGFVIAPMDGGSVQLTFRVKCSPDEKAVGKLSRLMGGEIEFSIESPDAGQDTLREAA